MTRTLKTATRSLWLILLLFCARTAMAQSVLDPADPVITYNSDEPPAMPPAGQIGKWVRTKKIGWNVESYKAYYYNGNAFRLKFPKSYRHGVDDGKRYPIVVFFHGNGERGGIYDNEYHLLHGSDVFRNAVDDGRFDGYVLYLQSAGAFGEGQFNNIRDILNYMIGNNKLDPFRVYANGLSFGGQGAWELMINFPHLVAASQPMSWTSNNYVQPEPLQKIKYTPIWIFQGGKDGNPAPYTTMQVRDAIRNAGGNVRLTEYPELGHGTWHTAWKEPDFFSWMVAQHKANPWPLGGRSEFCPGDVINVTLGLSPGMEAYEWRRDGQLIGGATGHTLTVTATGTYEARVKSAGLWSPWSPTPAVIRIKPATVSPDIRVSGLASRVLPALDGSTTVALEVPGTYVSYLWQRTGSNATIGTESKITVGPGDYRIQVNELYGCSSNFSNVFTVGTSGGPNAPDGATKLVVSSPTKTSLRLDWSENPAPAVNETAFEIYAGTSSGGPYKLVALTPADTRKWTVEGLKSGTEYFFRVRAVSNTAAAAPSHEGAGRTATDAQVPAAPGNLRIAGSTRTSISVAWNAATDDVGILKYEVYVNGAVEYVTQGNTFTLSGLQTGRNYTVAVRAIDPSGNRSPYSNQVSGQAILSGLDFKYYTYTTNWTNLPDFKLLTPAATGNVPNVTIANAQQADRFAFLWEGYIHIPVAGAYYFRTNSDDGSRLWLGALNATGSPYNFSTASIVNNDGSHGLRDATSAVQNLSAGVYPIAIAYFNGTGGKGMTVSWRTPATGTNYVAIPNSAFGDKPVVNGTAPLAPHDLTALAVSSGRINLNWVDRSGNETGFELYRSTLAYSGFEAIARVGANVTSYADTGLKQNTRYYYRVRAIGEFGESAFDPAGQGVDYDYHEISGLTNLPPFTTTPKKTGRVPAFNLGIQDRADNFQIKYTGTLNVPASGVYTFYTRSDDGSRLYIGGFAAGNLVVENGGLHGVTEKSGSKYLTKGLHQIVVTYMEATAGESLVVSWSGPGLPKAAIAEKYLGIPHTNATTLAPLTAPAYPAGLQAGATSKTAVRVSWTDRSTNETGFEVFRSAGGNSDYVKYAVLAPNTTQFQDTGLFANALFYYKVRAVNGGGASAYTPEDSARTWNTAPVVADAAARTARQGATTVLRINARDEDGDVLTWTATNLPPFATLAQDADGTARLTLNPSSADRGTYTDLTLAVADPFGGSDATSFTLTVNDNWDPVIGAVGNRETGENTTLQLPLSATDANGDPIAWTVASLPFPSSFTAATGSNTTLRLQPGYSAAGTYPVSVTAADGKGGASTLTFTLTVTDRSANRRLLIRYAGNNTGAEEAPAAWNSLNATNASGLKEENGTATTIGLSLQTGAWNVRNDGPATGSNSGVFPDAVLKNYYYFGTYWAPASLNPQFTGLNPARRYNLKIHGGTRWTDVADNKQTVYTAGGKSVALNVQHNSTLTADFTNLQPAADGTLSFSITKGTGAYAGFLNALVLTELYDDGSAPAAPANLTVQNVPGSGIRLTWDDRSYNESEFEVYRATNAAGPFTLAGVAPADEAAYVDRSVTGTTVYYYRVRSANTHGASAFTGTVSATSLNRLPVLQPVDDIVLRNNTTATVTVRAEDDAADPLKLTAVGLPPFATFTDNGNGTGTLELTPALGSVGEYRNIEIRATDGSDSSRSDLFNIRVTDKDVNTVYLNFMDGGVFAPRPWNNLTLYPFAGTVFNNLTTDDGAPSGITVTLPDGFSGLSRNGAQPGNGHEVYAPEVLKTAYYNNEATAKRMVVTGLNDALRYNFTFFASRDNGSPSKATYTIGAQSVTLEASYNINRTASINAVQPVNGTVTISVTRPTGSEAAMISSLVIESYAPASVPLMGPNNLSVTGATLSTVSLQWADRAEGETAYEVYRTTSAGAAFTLLATLPANSTSYTDPGLTADRVYYYTVRARMNTSASPYSDVVKGQTYGGTIHVNFNHLLRTGNPWNGLNNVPQQGNELPNLRDNTGNISSISLTVTGFWDGLYDWGMNTGNNSGVVPDAVMGENYGLFPGSEGSILLTGLKRGQKYDFTFFGSSQSGGDVTTAYSVGGRTVRLNTSRNTSGTVTLYGVEGDEFGNALVVVTPGAQYSEFGLLGALIIQSYTPTVGNIPQAPATAAPDRKPAPVAEAAPATGSLGATAYPNPFRAHLSVTVPAETGDRLQAELYDLQGRRVAVQSFSSLSNGMNYLQLSVPQGLSSGTYLLKLRFANRPGEQALRVVKQ